MIILGIETSCDETGAAVLEKRGGRIQILSNVVASSADLQAKYGGIIPEQAAREQIKAIIPVIEEALMQALPDKRLLAPLRGRSGPRPSLPAGRQVGARNDEMGIDAIAVTYGPGLIGSLLVGVETAKTLSLVWRKPLIPVNHLIGHFYANWITSSSLRATAKQSSMSNNEIATGPSDPRNDDYEKPTFPCIGLLVSGGHTDLVLFTDHGKYKYLGGTRDDAAGECFDKCARLLGLSYPGGPEISKLAEKGKDTYKLPRPMIDSGDFDFSFSGLKTAVARITSEESKPTSEVLHNMAASIEAAIIDVLIEKTIRAAKKYRIEQIMVAGGVAANQKLVDGLQGTADRLKIKLHVPPAELCTDNGAMIAAAGFYQKPIKNSLNLQADPNLSLAPKT